MAREVEPTQCEAWVIWGSAQVGAMQPCARFGGDYCLKDLRNEEGLANVAISMETCFADERDGVVDPATPDAVIEDIRNNPGSIGARWALDAFLRKPEAE